MSLAAAGQDGNGLQHEKLWLNFQVVSAHVQKIDVNGCGLFSFCEFRLHLALDVQRDNIVHTLRFLPQDFRNVWTKNLQNPREEAWATWLVNRLYLFTYISCQSSLRPFDVLRSLEN